MQNNRRKNYLPAALITVFLWLAWITIFFLIPPEYSFAPLLFIVVTFLSIFFTSSLLFGKIRHGLLVGLGILFFMALNFYGIGNYLNYFLVLAILTTIEYYFHSR